MRVRNIIIITSGKSDLAGRGWLDRYIQFALNWGKRPLVVLGPEGDHFLAESESIEKCELLFDDSYQGCEFSSVKTGVLSTSAPSIVLRLRPGLPSLETLKKLEEGLRTPEANAVHVMQSAADTELNMITQSGVAHLKTLPPQTDWLQSDRVTCFLYQTNSAILQPEI